jgi:5-methylcytosine-specific restriction endonuclease McrA
MDGAVTLTAVRLLAPHLTTDNCDALLEAARHKSKREVLELVACLVPQPDVASSVRRLPSPRPPEVTSVEQPLGSSVPTAKPAVLPVIEKSQSIVSIPPPPPRATVAPLAPERYLIKVTVSGETHAKLRRAQDLLRHTLPTGDPAAIVDRALTVLVEQLERTRLAQSHRPRSTATSAANTRHVPANVRRLVWERDAGRCAFVGTQGRCLETGFLEIHHLVPYAAGGATSVDNLALRCRSHNAHEAVQYFGATRASTSSSGRAKGAERGDRDGAGGALPIRFG